MDESSKVYVGMDVHKKTIAIARALPGREPARPIGEIARNVDRLVNKLQPLGDRGRTIGAIRQVTVQGLEKVDQQLTLTMAAYNPKRVRSLAALRPQSA